MTSDQHAPSRRPTEVVAVARRAVQVMSAPAWQQSKVQVTLETVEPEVWTIVDEQRLLQILVNLLHTAVIRTLPGGVVVVQVRRLPGTPIVRVCTSGGGELPVDLSRIHGLIGALDCTLIVESVPSEGDCLSITLPCAP